MPRDDLPVRLRIFDRDQRGFEGERDYPDVNILLMTDIEAALRDGRAMQIERATPPAKGKSK